MALANLIDLIAEVAVKRATREGSEKAETPDAVISVWQANLAVKWRRCLIFSWWPCFRISWARS